MAPTCRGPGRGRRDAIDNRVDGDAIGADAARMLVLTRAAVEAVLDVEDPRVRRRSR
jgi:hypothetical protein